MINHIFIYSIPLLVTYDKIRRAKKLMIQVKSNFVIYDCEDTIYWILKYLKPNISNFEQKNRDVSFFQPFLEYHDTSSLMNYKFPEEGSFVSREIREKMKELCSPLSLLCKV